MYACVRKMNCFFSGILILLMVILSFSYACMPVCGEECEPVNQTFQERNVSGEEAETKESADAEEKETELDQKTNAFGAEGEETEFWVNPEYPDLSSGTEWEEPSSEGLSASDEEPIQESVNDAAVFMRDQMISRSEGFLVSVHILSQGEESASQLRKKIWDLSFEHTGNPNAGDYLFRSVSKATFRNSVRLDSEGFWSGTILVTPQYFCGITEEEELKEEIKKILSELNTGNGSELEKATAVYTWICNHVSYDYAHLSDDSYLRKYTAYAAVKDGTAVCQGYAMLAYNLALRLGIDCRIISGGNHAWNIMRINRLYYLCDVTWDSEVFCASQYRYYLRGEPYFTGHSPKEIYKSEAFRKQYPLAQTDCVFPETLKVRLERITAEKDEICLIGKNAAETIQVTVEPSDAYDKKFGITTYGSLNVSTVFPHNKNESILLTVSSNNYGSGSAELTAGQGQAYFRIHVICKEDDVPVRYTASVENDYRDAEPGAYRIALYPMDVTKEAIEEDIRGSCSLAEEVIMSTQEGIASAAFAVRKGNYFAVVWKKGYLAEIWPIQLQYDRTDQIRIRALGDTDFNGGISVSDIIFQRDVILGVMPEEIPDPADLKAADVNEDGAVTVTDIIMVRDRILDLLKEDYTAKEEY